MIPNRFPAPVPTPADWSPASWQAVPALQQPVYPDAARLAEVLRELSSLPPLVTSWEIERLKTQLAEAARGERFLLQGGDCAESFDDCTSDAIANKLKILLQMSLVLVHGARRRAPWTSTRLICSRILSLLAMASEVQSSKLSAQSPPWRRKRSPRAASASCVFSRSISHEVTSGGRLDSSRNTSASRAASGYTGCCSAGTACQEAGDQSAGVGTGAGK